MRFTVYAFSTIPDLETARKNFKLDDLSDEDVTKVLFHQRKQQTGHSEVLNWDQLKIASVSLLHHTAGHTEISTHSLADAEEAGLIRLFFEKLDTGATMVSWNGNNRDLPLLYFRCMKHRISDGGYWNAARDGQPAHVALREHFAPASVEVPDLDTMAQRLHFPGMLGRSDDGVWDAYLAGENAEIGRHSELCALNTYLLALQLFALRGELDAAEADGASDRLHDLLEGGRDPGREAFLDAWGESS